MNTKKIVSLSVIVLGLLTLPAPAQIPSVPPPPAPIGQPDLPSSLSLMGQPPSAPLMPLPPPSSPPPYASPPPYSAAPPYSSGTPFYPAPGSRPPLAFQESGPETSFWSIGVGVAFMEAIFQSNPAFINGHTAANGNLVYRQTDFSQRGSAAPSAFIGYTWDGGWGIRGRWFEFSGSSNASTTVGGQGIFLPGGLQVNSASAGDQATASNVLYCDVIDLEATYTMLGDHWSLIASAGVRYVHLNQSYSLNVSDPANGTASAYSINNFDGTGPTVSLEGHRQIGLSNFAFYGSARGSVVFGEAHQWGSLVDPGSSTVVVGGHQTSVLCIGEMELGVEWCHKVGRFRMFTQAGCVGQLWGGAGNPSQALGTYFANITPGSNIGFIGGVFRAGINF